MTEQGKWIRLPGGLVLMLIGLQLVLSLWGPSNSRAPVQRHPLLIGVILSVAKRAGRVRV